MPQAIQRRDERNRSGRLEAGLSQAYAADRERGHHARTHRWNHQDGDGNAPRGIPPSRREGLRSDNGSIR